MSEASYRLAGSVRLVPYPGRFAHGIAGLTEEDAVRPLSPVDLRGDHRVALRGDGRLCRTPESVRLRPTNFQKSAGVPRRCRGWREVVLKEK